MRLSEYEANVIKQSIYSIDPQASVYLFGSSADDFVKIRIVRNQIAHEYIPEEINEIFKKVLKYTPKLLESVNRVRNYAKKFAGDEPPGKGAVNDS